MKIQVSVPVKEPGRTQAGVRFIDNSSGATLSEKIKAQLDVEADWYVFRHEDLSVPADFGPLKEQLAFFDREHVGVAGVIGTLCLFESLTWWNPMRPQVTVGAITQGFSNGQPDVLMADGPGIRTDAVSVDGCCMAFSREFLEKFEPHPFHWRFGYDVDACLQALSMGYKVGIMDFPCRHQSEGKFDPGEFERFRQQFLAYWKPRVDFPVIHTSKFRRA